MKAVERKLNKAQLATVWLLIISVLLTVAYVTVILVANYISSKNSGSNGIDLPKPMEGEDTYLNQLVAYPAIEESQITFLEVTNSKGKFGISRYPDDKGGFIFHYYLKNEDGTYQDESSVYMPPISGTENDFNYESLYAIETGDGIGQYSLLTYLCSAIGAPSFTERIDLPPADTEENKAKREAMLRGYGITQDDSITTSISFMYGERDKEGNIIEDSEEPCVLLIGNKAISGSGYYFMVGGREDYVYYTPDEYFTYAIVGFNEFVKGRLVAEGIQNESVYGPYLTTDFKEWKTTVYKAESDRVFSNDETEYKNYENPTVIVNGGYKVSLDKGLDFVPDAGDFSGYEVTDNDRMTFNLESLKDHPDYARIKKALVGKTVGSYSENKIILTLLNELYSSDSKRIDFEKNESVKYEYSISKIEAVITDDGEITSGTVGESDTLLKVTYRYTVGGQTVKHDCHAVINTNNFDSDKEKFIGVPIGEDLGSDAITLTVDYTKENSLSLSEKYVLKGVTAIFDEYGAIADVITENSYINISYSIAIGASKESQGTALIPLADIKDSDRLSPLKTILLGKGKGEYNETIYNREFYYEYLRDFVTYEISEIEYFTANELIVSFSFSNASKRDPYYGETFFKNTLSNEYKLYGLNDGPCLTVVKLLGGVGTDSNSAVGFSGKTVAIGLTLENMEKYGLLAHKIYFEMPRGIYDKETGSNVDTDVDIEEDADDFSDFEWLRTLGFTLYISDVEYDENGAKIRYIGSDMYDLIAKVPADDFEFLNYGFTEFWARKHLVMMDITKLEGLRLEFNMEDLKGEYDFSLEFENKYGSFVNGDFKVRDEAFEGATFVKNYETVTVKASDDAFSTLFKEMNGTAEMDLTTVYRETLGGGKTGTYPGGRTNYGAAYFNTAYETLQLTRYFDDLTEEEQEIGFTKTRIMRMHLKVEGRDYYYTYDFYRIDDRRVMVCLYMSDEEGNKLEGGDEVSDYYITTFAFKKLVAQYKCLLNGEHFDESVSYT